MTSQLTHYKPTGINWLSNIPQHWKSLKLRSILKHVSAKNRPNLPLLSITRERGIILRDISSKEENHNYIPDDLTNYKVVFPGQFGINKMKAWQGSYGVSTHHGIISPAYYTFNLIGVTGDFFHLAIRSKAYIPFFTQASDGVRVGQWDLSLTRMKEIPFFIPPEEEQRKIVKVINLVNLKLNKFILKKKRLIELLKEQKQVIISQTVTRGLDPNVRLKPSGVDWLGDIPEHWELRRIKTLSVVKRGASPRPIDDPKYFDPDGEYSWVRIKDVSSSNKFLLKTEQKLSSLGASMSVKLEPGTLFLSIAGSVGKPMISKIKCCIHDGFVYFPYINGNLDFIFLILASGLPYRGLGKLGTQLNLNTDIVGNICIPFPSAKEQIEIAAFLTENIKDIDNKIRAITDQVNLIHEYRTRFISDVVTGQIDIRNIEISDIVEEEFIEEALEEEQEEESLELVGASDDD